MPDTKPDTPTCPHGHLRRSCELCERDTRIYQLERGYDELRKIANCLQRALSAAEAERDEAKRERDEAQANHAPHELFCPHCLPCRHREKLNDYDETLRGLASFVAAGGYNSNGLIEPKVADEKIRWGIDHVVSVERKRANRAESALASRAGLVEALTFYAEKQHFMLGDETWWDTVSDEPQNFWCDEAGTATVEDGEIARRALASAETPNEVPTQDKETGGTELLPCPFCGGHANYGECFGQKPITYFVCCSECLASTNQLSPCLGLPKDEAAKDWNRRTPAVREPKNG